MKTATLFLLGINPQYDPRGLRYWQTAFCLLLLPLPAILFFLNAGLWVSLLVIAWLAVRAFFIVRRVFRRHRLLRALPPAYVETLKQIEREKRLARRW